MSDGVERSRSTASMRLDLPEPLGPIITFRGDSSVSGVFGPYDRKFRNRIDFRNLFIGVSDTSTDLNPKVEKRHAYSCGDHGIRSFHSVQRFHGSLDLVGDGVHVAQSASRGRDRLADAHLQWARFDVVSIHGQQFKGAD
jgi:hypothetical protein